jgi:hypothetical protein
VLIVVLGLLDAPVIGDRDQRLDDRAARNLLIAARNLAYHRPQRFDGVIASISTTMNERKFNLRRTTSNRVLRQFPRTHSQLVTYAATKRFVPSILAFALLVMLGTAFAGRREGEKAYRRNC